MALDILGRLNASSLPLARFPSVSTSNLDEAVAIFARLASPITVERVDRKASFGWHSHRVSLGGVAIAAHAYGGSFRATSEEAPDLFTLSFPLGDVKGEASTPRVTQTIARGESTYLGSPSGRTTFELGTHYRGLQLLVTGDAMKSTLAALLGAETKEPLRFEPRLSLRSGVGASLARLVDFAAHEADNVDGVFDSPIAAARLAESMLAHLLLDHPHNYSARLAQIRRAAAPRHVRIAVEYIDANAAKSIRMADLASIAGVSVRALQLGFLEHRGCTPMEFVRARRLDLARARLLVAGASSSVSDVARACGFDHFGRFSARYRARFGELPSKTRRRAR